MSDARIDAVGSRYAHGISLLLALTVVSCGLVVSFDGYSAEIYGAQGAVSGLDGRLVTLVLDGHRQWQGSEAGHATRLEVGDGPFAFAPALGDLFEYTLGVETHPPGVECVVEHGRGTIVGGDAIGIVVRCTSGLAPVPSEPSVHDPRSPAQFCTGAINELRAAHGLPSYDRWTAAESCADGEALRESATQQSHSDFGECGESAQNECAGWRGPAGAMIGPCLRAIRSQDLAGEAMFDPEYTQVACGFATAPDGTIWSVQLFR